MDRAFYSVSIQGFLSTSPDVILAELVKHNSFDLTQMQKYAWIEEIRILQDQLSKFDDGNIIFEYTIPRMGKRVDTVILYKGIIFLLEFKVGATEYSTAAISQVVDYALDLKNFHKDSHDRIIVPIAVATNAETATGTIRLYKDRVSTPLCINKTMIGKCISQSAAKFDEVPIDTSSWVESDYMPTPTIIEAAQALYNKHKVEEITRSDAGAKNLTCTTNSICKIIEFSRMHSRKSIIFVTGVPGAGKTLVGLNLASNLYSEGNDRAVFLSGNHPLVTVLQEALVRDKMEQSKEAGKTITKTAAERQVKSIIQMIYRYRNEYFGNDRIPDEHIAIFDEAQRAWTNKEMVSFMMKKSKVSASGEAFKRDIQYSEPGFLISTMDRRNDWAVIVCLVGGGQEINRGEAGLPEWFLSMQQHFSDWDVYSPANLVDKEYLREYSWVDLTRGLCIKQSDSLHLATSMRSFRSEKVALLVKQILDSDFSSAAETYSEIKERYPIVITRSLDTAKQWVKEKSRGNERYGLLASSNAARLKPYGVYYAKDRSSISPENWFLNPANDLRSSSFLEVVASEFETQGLELDYTIVAWDGDLRIDNGKWACYTITTRLDPPGWTLLRNEESKRFLINAYRVLLTRARQGMIIYVPHGVDHDFTRTPAVYDQIYNTLKSIGFMVIDP